MLTKEPSSLLRIFAAATLLISATAQGETLPSTEFVPLNPPPGVMFNLENTSNLPVLIVSPGETVTLSARLHQFGSVHVKRGGTLNIQERSSRWTILWVSGNVTIDGTIRGRKCQRTATSISAKTPDGKTVEHKYASTAIGGRGGMADASTQLGAGNRSGGAGAAGTKDYGGGGGSGGGIHIQGHATRLGSNGNTASDWRGAPPAADGGYGNKGGDGGRLATHSNGCLLLIYSEGTMDGSGTVDLRGEIGAMGIAGGDGIRSNRGYLGAGGGGGGSPGGEGGRLVLVAKDILREPTPYLDGGIGGKGGAPGRYSNYAEKGSDGENGSAGYSEVFLLDQWQQEEKPVKVQ